MKNLLKLSVFSSSIFLLSFSFPSLANQALVNAAEDGNIESLSSLLEQGIDADSPIVDGSTALHMAVYHEQEETVLYLVEHDASVVVENRYGVTPLYISALNGNTVITQALLKAGAKPNVLAPTGESILMTASRTGVPEVISQLLDAGASVNFADQSFGQTALMLAVRENHPHAVELLLNAGANPNAATRIGETPDFTPPCKGTGCGSEGVGINRGGLPERGKREATKGGMTALLYAAREGRLEAAQLLVNAGANIEQAEANAITPLSLSLINGELGVANLLLDAGAEINTDDFWGRTPLWAVVDYRNMDMNTKLEDDPVSNHVDREAVMPTIKRLLDMGANVNARTKELIPPRRWLYALNDVSWVDYTGQTAFLRAAFAGDTQTMNLLLEYGADPNIATFAGTTPLMAASGVGWVVDQTYTESMSQLIAAIDICLAHGADVNASNSMGLTALLGAANKGANDIIMLLVDNDANLFVADAEGRTPNRWAEGVFLAAVGAEQKPLTIALLNRLIEEAQ